MEIKQTQKLTQKLAITPQMKQSLHVLQLPILELKNYLENEIEENPVIESQTSQEGTEELTASEKINILEELPKEDIYQDYPVGDDAQQLQKQRDYRESLITKPINLQEILLKQLRMSKLEEKKQKIGELIISHIDENGYLNISLDEILAILNKEQKPAQNTVTLKTIEEVLSLIQVFEPLGVGARNLKECLLIQLKAHRKRDSLVYKIVENFLTEVAKNKIRFIAKRLNVHPNKVKKALKEISNLEPKPGREFSPSPNTHTSHLTPDVVLEKHQGKYEIIVNSYGLPKFRISSKYKSLLKSNEVPLKTKAYIQEKIKSAMGLMKAISQRDQTLRKVVQNIVDIQKDFFEHADPASLKPLTLRKIASLVNRNESTISRVVNNKYIKTSHGTFKLNYFFTKPLKDKDLSLLSKETIKSQIFNIISEENKKTPLKDSQIVKLLKHQGINIARRTIAKYREELKIPPANRRKM